MIQNGKLKRRIRIVSRKVRKAAKAYHGEELGKKIKTAKQRDIFWKRENPEKDCLTQSYAKPQSHTTENKYGIKTKIAKVKKDRKAEVNLLEKKR